MESNLTLIAIAVVTVSACSTTRIDQSASIYEAVSKQLVEARYTSVCCGYAGYWLPLGQAHFGGIAIDAKQPTKEQEEHLQVSLNACISKLKQEYIGVNAAMATSQLIECMRIKGWSHGFDEFVTTS